MSLKGLCLAEDIAVCFNINNSLLFAPVGVVTNRNHLIIKFAGDNTCKHQEIWRTAPPGTFIKTVQGYLRRSNFDFSKTSFHGSIIKNTFVTNILHSLQSDRSEERRVG